MKNTDTRAPVAEGARATVRTLMLGSLPAPVLSRIQTLIQNTDNKYQGDRQLLLKYHAKRENKEG